MRYGSFAAGLLVALAACTPAPDPALQAMKDAVEQCKAQSPFEKGTARDREVCLREAVQDWGHESPTVDTYLELTYLDGAPATDPFYDSLQEGVRLNRLAVICAGLSAFSATATTITSWLARR